jgi:hypothetical protein
MYRTSTVARHEVVIVYVLQYYVLNKTVYAHTTTANRTLIKGKRTNISLPFIGDRRHERFSKALKGKPRGTLDIELLWSPRLTEDDVSERKKQQQKAIILQCWVRQRHAISKCNEVRRSAALVAATVRSKATGIQMTWRCHVAREVLRLKRRAYRNACTIQRCARVRIARRAVAERRRRRDAVIIIQCACRQKLARHILAVRQVQRQQLKQACAITIQRIARSKLAKLLVSRMRVDMNRNSDSLTHATVPAVAEWLPSYGTDTVYGTKRLKRITERAFLYCLETPGKVLHSKPYGIVESRQYPTPTCTSQQATAIESAELRDTATFVCVSVRGVADLKWHKAQRIPVTASAIRYPAVIRLSCVDTIKTVAVYATRIQCPVRYTIARKRTAAAALIHQQHLLDIAVANKRKSTAAWLATRISIWASRRRAAKQAAIRAQEEIAAIKLQCAWRVKLAKGYADGCRVICDIEVIDSSGCSDTAFDASNTLIGGCCGKAIATDINSDSNSATAISDRQMTADDNNKLAEGALWTSAFGAITNQWIVYDIGKSLPIGKLRLHGLANTTCPRIVRLECCKTVTSLTVPTNNSDWTPVINRCEMKCSSNNAHSSAVNSGNKNSKIYWQTFDLPRRLDDSTCARYWRVYMENNHGNTSAIALRGVQFLLAKEYAPSIQQQSDSILITPPPLYSTPDSLLLCVNATAWPPPTYQWYHNGTAIPNATASELKLLIESTPTATQQADAGSKFKCIHCKQAAYGVPANAWRINCGNCSTPYISDEYTAAIRLRPNYDEQYSICYNQLIQCRRAADRANALLEQAKLRSATRKGISVVAELELLTLNVERTTRDVEVASEAKRNVLQSALHYLRHEDTVHLSPEWEGSYTCIITNMRAGGTIANTITSDTILVVSRDPEPYSIKTRMDYIPKHPCRRRIWTKYASVVGWFSAGRLRGDVSIRYTDDAVYDGPYIDDRWLDTNGRIPYQARAPGHWGIYTIPNNSSSTTATTSAVTTAASQQQVVVSGNTVPSIARGVVFEGLLVCNHFDQSCVNGHFRVTMHTGDVYEGNYIDEEKHGIGRQIYIDGSIYEGEWHRGQRQGFGTITMIGYNSNSSSNNSNNDYIYQGEWDHNIIHGKGYWKWYDGRCYIGDNWHGKRQGTGLHMTGLGESYYGTFNNNSFDGVGLFNYSDGSSYKGEFKAGLRHGNGVYTDSKGTESHGTYVRDNQSGVFTIRCPIWIPEEQHTEYEVRTGLWESGIFIQWCSAPVYPHATKQFCAMFEDTTSDAYDGVYAMLVTRQLPLLPRGVDETDPRVQRIVTRLADEGGLLTCSDTINEYEQREIDAKPKCIALANSVTIAETAEAAAVKIANEAKATLAQATDKLDVLVSSCLAVESELNQAFADDTHGRRAIFNNVVASLSKLTSTDWFQIRNYDDPPPILDRLLKAVCLLLGVPETWRSAQNLLSSSLQNMQSGDQEALHVVYDCKLVYKLASFDPYSRVDTPKLMMQLSMFVMDPRFESGNYFLTLYGGAVAPMVALVHAAYHYMAFAAKVTPKQQLAVALRSNIKLSEKALEKDQSVVNNAVSIVEVKAAATASAKREHASAQQTLQAIQDMLVRARGLVTVYQKEETVHDVYSLMEKQLLNSIHTTIETALEQIVTRIATTAAASSIMAAPQRVDLQALMASEVQTAVVKLYQQGIYTAQGGLTLCSNYAAVSVAQNNAVLSCTEAVHKALHTSSKQIKVVQSLSADSHWCMLDGTRISNNTIEKVLAIHWEKTTKEYAVTQAINNWSAAFPDTEEAARQALITTCSSSTTNNSGTTGEQRAEAILWINAHQSEVQAVQYSMAQQFEEWQIEDTANASINIAADTMQSNEARALAIAWQQVHSNEIRAARTAQTTELAAAYLEENDGDVYKCITNLMRSRKATGIDSLAAEAWASCNITIVANAETAAAVDAANEFQTLFPDTEHTSTAAAAAVYLLAAKMPQSQDHAEGSNERHRTEKVLLRKYGLGARSWSGMHEEAVLAAQDKLTTALNNELASIKQRTSMLERRLSRLLEARRAAGINEQDELLSLTKARDARIAALEQKWAIEAQTVACAKALAAENAAHISATTATTAVKGTTTTASRKAGRGGGVRAVTPARRVAPLTAAQQAAILVQEQAAELAAAAVRDAEYAAACVIPQTKADEIRGLIALSNKGMLHVLHQLVTMHRSAREMASVDQAAERALNETTLRPSQAKQQHDDLRQRRTRRLHDINYALASCEKQIASMQLVITTSIDVCEHDDTYSIPHAAALPEPTIIAE